jgi:AcrR family transcriptional regulator
MTATVRGFDDPARQALDRAARALFDVHGYAGTHISAIAREAGVSISTFYSRYGSKDQAWRDTMGTEPPNASDQVQPLSGRSRRTRDALIEAARACIERGGYHATRISDIADHAGAAVGSFYSYFPSKQAVFTAVIQEVIADIERRNPSHVLTPPRSRSSRQLRRTAIDQIGYAIERFVDRYADRGAVLMLRLDEAIGSHPELMALRLAVHEQFADAIANSIRRWQDAGIVDPNLDPQHTADALAAMVGHATRVWLVFGRPHDRQTAIDTLTQLWANGIGLRRRY